MANTHSIDLEKDSSQYLSITDAAQTGLDITGDLTIEFWCNPETLVYNHGVVAKGGITNPAFFAFISGSGGTGTLNLYVYDSSGNTTRYSTNAGVAITGSWQHYAIVFTAASHTIQFYKDGSPITSNMNAEAATSIRDNNQPFLIGYADNVGYFDGLIDEVRIWNDVRTSGEISSNYNKELVGNEANLAAYWKLNNSLLDETSNNNDLTNNNSAAFSTDVPTFIVSSIKKVAGVAYASIKKIGGVAIASVKKVAGVS